MFQIICPTCLNRNSFETVEKKPAECFFCFTKFDDAVKMEETADEKKGTPCGLKLVCQQNSESIIITGNSCILGRENTGAQLFSKILINGNPVISRKQCSINFVDGNYYLKDEGSRNGTFYGVSKIDCSVNSQIIEDNSIIFLGKEAFWIQFLYDEPKVSEAGQTDAKAEESGPPHKYRCNEGCGFESETYYDICPKCMTSNSMVEIHKD